MIVSGTIEYEQWAHERRVEGGRKAGLASKGRKPSPESNAKRSVTLTGIKRGPHSPESNAKRSASLTGRKQSPETVAKKSTALTGRKHSPEHIAKRTASFRKTRREHPEKWQNAFSSDANMKRSKSLSQGILEGRFHPEHGRGGDFWSGKNQKKLYYRSQLELRWYQVLEQLAKVERYEVEPVAIPYEWKGSIHLYHPDLMVFYTNHTLELVEIKPEGNWCRKDPLTQAKWAAARKWCDGPGRRVVFCIWGCNELDEVFL